MDNPTKPIVQTSPGPAKEPVKTIKTGQPGNEAFSEEQYRSWLDDMAPFLKTGNSLNYCIDKANLTAHKVTIYNKYKLNDWFSEKIDTYRSYPGELVNKTIVNLAIKAHDDLANDRPLSKEQYDILKFFAEKHRTAQPFFVTRTETATADPKKIGKILDNLEQTDYGELGQEAKKQMVAHDAPVQDQGQKGPNSNIPA